MKPRMMNKTMGQNMPNATNLKPMKTKPMEVDESSMEDESPNAESPVDEIMNSLDDMEQRELYETLKAKFENEDAVENGK